MGHSPEQQTEPCQRATSTGWLEQSCSHVLCRWKMSTVHTLRLGTKCRDVISVTPASTTPNGSPTPVSDLVVVPGRMAGCNTRCCERRKRPGWGQSKQMGSMSCCTDGQTCDLCATTNSGSPPAQAAGGCRVAHRRCSQLTAAGSPSSRRPALALPWTEPRPDSGTFPVTSASNISVASCVPRAS